MKVMKREKLIVTSNKKPCYQQSLVTSNKTEAYKKDGGLQIIFYQ